MPLLDRRDFLAACGATLAATDTLTAAPTGARPMYGLIGVIEVLPGQREALTAILLEGLQDMPGCLSYIVAHDPADGNALWITEAWDSKASHQASLSLPGVQVALSRGRPLIKGFRQRVETQPVGGQGLTLATPG